MLNDPRPLTLRSEDCATPRDPQAEGIALMALLRDIEDEVVHLQSLFTRWGDDPVGVMRKAQARTIEIRELALRAPVMGESLMQALRASGVLASQTRRP